MRTHRLTLNAYGWGRRLLAQAYVADGVVQAALERLFADVGVAYVHVRDTEAGCYDLRVERGDAARPPPLRPGSSRASYAPQQRRSTNAFLRPMRDSAERRLS